LDGLYKNSIIYGLGLVVSAVIQTLQDQLDLYHAIFVIQIIFSLDFVYAFSMCFLLLSRRSFLRYRRSMGIGQRRFILSSGNDFSMKIYVAAQTFSTVVFTIWSLYVCIKGGNFGSQPECNHLVKYAFFFANVSATATWLRVLFLINLVLNSCVLLWTFGAIFMEYLHKGIHTKLRGVVIASTTNDAEQPGQKNTPRKMTVASRKFSAAV
jgi:hypothetical protein